MDTCLNGLENQIFQKHPLGLNKYPRFGGLKKRFSEKTISEKYSALIALFQTGTRATKISMAYENHTKVPFGLKSLQLSTIGGAQESDLYRSSQEMCAMASRGTYRILP
jgi:hypothetical protein